MTQQVHKTVFISYRRSVSSYLARAIYMDLKQHGYDVFMDVQSIDSGMFDDIILRQIEARAHFLILCTPGTFERVNEPGDWLRREIEHAMQHNRNIVPILANDFRFDAAAKALLTESLAQLPGYNAVSAPHDYFEEALERLRTRFLKLPVGVTLTPPPAADARQVAAQQAQIEQQPAPTVKELSAEEYFNRGVARNDNSVEEIADYNEAIRLNPQFAEAYNNRGAARKAQGDHDGAIADYTEAIRLNPQYAAAYNNRGVARKAQGDLGGALADYNEAIRLNPRYADAYYNRGNARKAQGDHGGALADYNEAIRLNPQLAEAYNNRGEAFRLKGDRDGAIADYTEAIRLNPQYAAAYNNRGIARKAQGDLGGAIADYNEAIRLNPKYANAYKNRGLAREQQRDYAGAADDLQRYLDLGGGKQYGDQAAVEARIRELKQKAGRK